MITRCRSLALGIAVAATMLAGATPAGAEDGPDWGMRFVFTLLFPKK